MTIPTQVNPTAVLGPVDEVLREIEQGYPDLTIVVRGNRISIQSHAVDSEANALDAERFLGDLIEAAASGSPLDADAVHRLLEERRVVSGNHGGLRRRVVREALGAASTKSHRDLRSRESQTRQSRTRESEDLAEITDGRLPRVITFALGVPVRPKTAGQIEYVDCIDHNVITFGIGPAGTGKTYLAVAKAVQAFENKQVRRIILTRPAVEAGENLGFLPGTLSEKIDPYLRPLYDALSDMLGSEQLKRYITDGTIEVAPLAYMRGRTLNDAFVILDEAQNTTEQQMKMFLTRLGFNTTMVVTGDVTQVDLGVTRSGLKSIERILGNIPTITFVHLGAADVVRHSLVGKIVQAYERHAEQASTKEKA
jgi:phosphate starvation-inducible PhoH-like protein